MLEAEVEQERRDMVISLGYDPDKWEVMEDWDGATIDTIIAYKIR